MNDKEEFMFEMNEELALETIKRFKIVNIAYKKYKDKLKLITKRLANQDLVYYSKLG